jgi:hypothetical protein
MRELAATKKPFTSDDLIARVGVPDEDHQANGRNNVVGMMFRWGVSEGLITSDNWVVPSRQPHRKGGGIRVWVGVSNPPSALDLGDTP